MKSMPLVLSPKRLELAQQLNAVGCSAHTAKHARPCSLLVKLVEAAARFLPQALVLIHQLDDAGLVHPVREGLVEVGAHVQPNVCAH